MKPNLQSILILLVFAFLSCHTKVENQATEPQDSSSLPLTYAQGFAIRYSAGYKEVTVYNPWKKGEVLERYYLVESKATPVPDDGAKIVVPLQSLAATACTHFEFLYLLHEGESITGICSPDLVYNADIRKRFAEGKIKNLGDAFSLNLENVLLLRPEALMVSGYNQSNETEKRVVQAGIPVIYNNEWTETSLLGRAEWIKFVAAFYNKEREADSIFSIIEQNYKAVSNKANAVSSKPTILSGSDFKGTWYMPNGTSYMARLFADAGGDYLYKNDTSAESLPLSFEMVLKNFRHADFWMAPNAGSMEELFAIDERYALFDAAQNGKVYVINKRKTPTGGNDFWESGVAHPDWVLSDLIKILHPEILPEHELIYMNQLGIKN